MLANAKQALGKLPVIGYALHWIVDLFTLPLIRVDLVREIRELQAVNRARQLDDEAQTRRYEALRAQAAEDAEGLSALRQSLRDALTQLDLIYARIVPGAFAGESAGEAQARAQLQKQLWSIERRLGELERSTHAGLK